MTTEDAPTPPARSSTVNPREFALQALCLVGLATAAMLLVDYVRPPVFCADHGSGCDVVRHSSFARPFGLPLPVPGALFFVALLGTSVLGAGERARRLLASLGLLGVLSGVALVAIQGLVLHHWCRYCLVVDLSSIVAGGLAMSLRRDVATDDRPAPRRMVPSFVVTGAALVALLVPLGYGLSRPVQHHTTPTVAALPAVVAQLQQSGVATIVEFVDFECPFCRHQQEALAPLLASYGPRVRVIRKNVPLPMHEHARDAARAACCAEEQGRGEAVAASLFHAEDLTPGGCERVVSESHADLAAYRACLASHRPDVVLERDLNDARASGVAGLPTLYVGVERFEGLTDADTLRASIERALHNSGAHQGG